MYVLILFFFFFFKQKTAYEMRISDWSSDVCSSDLARRHLLQREHGRLAALVRTVELRTVEQFALVMHLHHVFGGGLRPLALDQHLVLQAGFGRRDAFLARIGGEESLAFAGVRLRLGLALGHLPGLLFLLFGL